MIFIQVRVALGIRAEAFLTPLVTNSFEGHVGNNLSPIHVRFAGEDSGLCEILCLLSLKDSNSNFLYEKYSPASSTIDPFVSIIIKIHTN